MRRRATSEAPAGSRSGHGLAADPQRSHTQRRGDLRRRALLEAASRLLARLDPVELTFASVCAEAGVPQGSARFFYADIHQLLRALMNDLGQAHDSALLAPFKRSEVDDWRSLVEVVVNRSAHFQATHPVYAKLTISGQTLPELKRIDRQADRQRSQGVLQLLDRYFVLPRVPALDEVTYLTTEIVDLAFSLSMSEAGCITPRWRAHAVKAAVAVLAAHVGELAPRPEGPVRLEAPANGAGPSGRK